MPRAHIKNYGGKLAVDDNNCYGYHMGHGRLNRIERNGMAFYPMLMEGSKTTPHDGGAHNWHDDATRIRRFPGLRYTFWGECFLRCQYGGSNVNYSITNEWDWQNNHGDSVFVQGYEMFKPAIHDLALHSGSTTGGRSSGWTELHCKAAGWKQIIGVWYGPAGTEPYGYIISDYYTDDYDCSIVLMVEASRGLENKI